MTKTADAIIVGAGVIGAATAFELAKSGLKTLSVDRNGEAGHGSTGGSCAIIRVHYSTLDGTALAYEGFFYWRDWKKYLGVTDERGFARFRQLGCLVMKTRHNRYLSRHLAHCDELGIPYQEWDEARILEKLPFYNLESFSPAKRMSDPRFGEPNGERVKSGVFWPTAGYVTDPALSTHNLQRAAEAHGSEFLLGMRVVEILIRDGRAAGVRLSSGEELHAPVVVNVAGPASSTINAMADVLDDMTMTTSALRHEVVHLPAPEGCDFYENGCVVSDSDISLYCRPELGNNILVGSEDPECDRRQWVDDDESYDRNFTDQWTHQAYRYAQRVPNLGIPSRMKGIVDLYDMTEDCIPIYDKSSLPGFYMACGTSGNQYKNAAIVGKMMTALIEYCEGGNDHDAAPLMFELPYTGRRINVGFYSRKRAINQESSFTVLG